MYFVLFEVGSAKWIELTDNNARFHSSIRNATKLEGEAVSGYNLHALLEKHKISCYASTIDIHPAPVS